MNITRSFLMKIAVGSVLILTVAHVGSPWNLHDGPACENVKFNEDCGQIAFYHKGISQWWGDARFRLIRDIVGDLPVIANIELKNPEGCNTGLDISGRRDSTIYVFQSTFGRSSGNECPAIRGR